MSDGPQGLRLNKAMAYTGIMDTGLAEKEAVKRGIIGPDPWVSPFKDSSGVSTIGVYKDQPEAKQAESAPSSPKNASASSNALSREPVEPARPSINYSPNTSGLLNYYGSGASYPMLIQDYSSPQAFDYSAYMPSDSPFGGMGGLLYQPGTQQYQKAFPMDMNILRYQPPEIPGSRVQFSNPILGFDVEAAIEEAANIANGGEGSSGGTSGDGGRAGEVTPASIVGAAAVPGTGTNVKGYSVGADGKLYGVDQNGLVIGPSGYPSVDLTSRLFGQPRPPEFAFTTSGVVPNAPSSTDRVNPAQMDRYGQLPSVADRYGRPGGVSADSDTGSTPGGEAGFKG